MNTQVSSPETVSPEMLDAAGLAASARGDVAEARAWFERAVAAYPEYAPGYANLAYTLLVAHEYAYARGLYMKAIEMAPEMAIAYHGLAQVCAAIGDVEAAEAYRERGLELRPVTVLRYTGLEKPIELLLLGTPGKANIETGGFFDPAVYRVSALSVDHFAYEMPLPQHDVIFNGIGEADLCADALRRASALLTGNTSAVINHPDRVLATGREQIARLLHDIPGVRTPKIVRVRRAGLAEATVDATLDAAGLSYPFLLRTPGYHAGEAFALIHAAEEIPAALAELPGEEYFAIEFLDARGTDRLYRKYRVLCIDGVLYPTHLAISDGWKVHYFSGTSALDADRSAEELRYLRNFEGELGRDVVGRLREIAERVGLDYGGIDFCVDQWGTLLVFEANATMGFAKPAPGVRWNERHMALQRAADAVQRMLLSASVRKSA